MADRLAFPRSNKIHGNTTDWMTNVSEVRQRICELTGLPSDEVTDEVDLFALGMDSIFVIRMAGILRRHGVRVSYGDLADKPTPAAWWALIQQRRGDGTATAVARPVHVDESAPFPLAAMQHAFWIGRAPSQELSGVAAHFYTEFQTSTGAAGEGGGGLDPGRLEQAVRRLQERHGMLRVRIGADGTQRIDERSSWPGLTTHDLRDCPAQETAARLDAIRSRLSHRVMDISAGEVFDVQLSLLGNGATRMHVNLDMVAADALSLRNLLADLAHLYERPDEPLPPIDYSYPRYLAERATIRRHTRNEARDWWREQLAELPGAPTLPVHSDEATGPTVTRRHHWLSPEDTQRLRKRAKEHGVTPATALATVFAETVGAWSSADRFLLNLPVFDREPLNEDVDKLVGDFSSSVMLDVDLSQAVPFAERASRIQARLRETSSHAEYTGIEVLRDLSRHGGGDRVLAPVVYTSALDLGDLFSPDVRHCFGEPCWIISQGPQVWLDAQVTEFNGGILANWDARDSVFPAGMLDAMFNAYVDLVQGLLDDAARWSEPVPPMLPAEQRTVRERVNDTEGATQHSLLHERFFAHARSAPDRTALLWGKDGSMSYGELSVRALRVAQLLRGRGVTPGDSVGVTLPKGPDQVVAVLGVLASGASYVPSGVDVPPARRAEVYRTAGVKFVLTDQANAARPQWPTGVEPLLVEDSAGCEPVQAPVPVDPESVMYVIFTSGSTGVPKGVEVPHRAVANTVDAVNDQFGIGAADRTIALSALDFDLSAYDLFAFLGYGGSVVVLDEAQRRDAAAWAELIRRWDVTVLSAVPALLDMLLVAGEEAGLGDTLRVVMLGGDWVTVDLPPRLRALVPGCRFAGLGGMTEAAIHATVCEVDTVDPAWRAVPYGVPLRNVACRVVDSRGWDCPDWVPGELWVSGAGVAHGYRGDPDRTAEKFVEYGGRRWYRTGDLTRYLPDGTLEFLGRTDHQVKIRGHRIELGEIESVLTGHPHVDKAVATVVRTASRQLAAAVVAHAPTDADALRAWLGDRLPGYMVPEHITVLDAFPITPNGKVDRKAINKVLQESSDRTDNGYQSPAGPIEQAVASLWCELLGVDRVGRGDDFFALGGDSLLATRLMRRLREDGLHGAELADLFTKPVLRDFAAPLAQGAAEAPVHVRADLGQRHDPFPLTDVQRAFWIGRDERIPLGGVGSYFYLEFDGDDVDLGRLEEAWNRLIARHEMLRAVITPEGTQRILPEVPRYRIRTIDAGHRPEAALHRLRQSASHHLVDTGTWPLFDIRAARYVSEGRQRTRVCVGLDSIVMDGRSIMVLYTEWDRLYADLDAELPTLVLSFRDYVLQARPDPKRLAEAESYWRQTIDQLPPAPRLPLVKDPAAIGKPVFHRLHHYVDDRTWTRLSESARAHGLTPSVVLLACYAEVLGEWSDQRELTVNMTLFDRRDVHPDIDRIVGDFASLLLVRHRCGEGEAFAAAARRLQEQQGRDLSHREASGVWVLRELARRSGSASAAVPVVFTSVLGIGEDASLDLSGGFPPQVYGVTQTPQVWLDNKVARSRGGITIDWDVVDDLFTEGLTDAMFDSYVRLVESLADVDWSAPLPPVLTEEHRALRDSAHAQARSAQADPVVGRLPDPAPGPSEADDAAGGFQEPAGTAEQAVARLWQEVLGVERVGRTDSFFALGGDSILATRLMTRLRAEGLSGAELARLFTNPVLHEFAATITPGAARATAALAADEEHRHDPFPLTDIQAAYWLGRSPDFVLGGIGAQLYVEYEREGLDLALLEWAWNQLVARHEMLRVVVEHDGTQRILPKVPQYRIPVIEAGDSPEADLERVREQMCHGTIDSATWPLFDIRVVRYGEDKARLCVVFDNIATDGLSILTLLAEWDRLYRDPDADLPEVGVSFRDYVLGATPEPETLERVLSYWRGRMADLPPGPRLPLRVQPGEIGRPHFVRRERRLDSATWQAITARARAHGLTPSVVLLSCYTRILGAWSARRDLTVNLTLFDRRDVHPDINRVVGDFTSLLLVADRPEEGESWLDRARRLQEQVWRDLDHQEVSAVRVLRELARENAALAEPVPVVFTSMLGVDDSLAQSVRWPDHTRSQTPQVWLDHQVIELPDGLLLSWDSVDELFPSGVVDAILDAYHELLVWLADGDWTRAAPESLPEGQRAVRERVNDTRGAEPEDAPGGGLLHGGFFEVAAADPERTALIFGDGQRLCYGPLGDWARRIARMLIQHGVRVGDPVAVSLPKGPAQVAALLGILAAGAAYVPAAVDQPPLRRQRILARADVRLLLGDDETPEPDGVRLLRIRDAERHSPVGEIRGSADGLAYTVFTSGSTGEPKGVEITHRSAVNTLDDLRCRYAIDRDDRVLAVSAVDFDLSVFDVFGLLGAGGGVVLIEEDDRRDPQRWLQLLHEHQVTIWNTVPAVLDMLLTVAESGRGLPRSLRLALASGDWVGMDLPDRLRRQLQDGNCRFVALGGATEASIWSNAFEVEAVAPEWASIPYGFPLRNQRFRVVDEAGSDRPDWVTGELWIGGTGAARGYRGDPELTAARFVEHDGTRWYRTGDLGRYWPDGTLEFLGRQDDQVKVRGHRIELGEIEAAVSAHPGVARAVAVAVEGRGGKRLVAFVQPSGDGDLAAFPRHLADRLPAYAIPEIIAVTEFPLTANGKVDRTALISGVGPLEGKPTDEPPATDRERELAALWAELLDHAPAQRHDNFFALGGDSLSATRLIQRVDRIYGVSLSLRDFFATPTIAHLADAVAEAITEQRVGTDLEEGSL
ncbi:non-ribosomal peptide synthetase [Streptomyces sp. NL15-2K]|uniref:non-ribosomal peptide synthetase n=1 Tax=Streptomyces sp. NL15-2K TaxID=376149 RepID=UPI000F57E38C|nr:MULTISPECIES: non-ribosomal peptide synthetase [Actinomycetes]WKX14105.1 non-ribosomal peptide synthetase [Kutzneria buriramensis]